MSARLNAPFTALLAAALFGATTPLAKALLGTLSPFMVAGLFYLGSGIGLAITILVRRLSLSTHVRYRCAKSHGCSAQSPRAASPVPHC
jgi:hypothetical protein